MAERVTRWALQDRAGRMPGRVLDRLVETGLLPPSDADGCWDSSILERLDAVVGLAKRARSLDRRVLLLHQTGHLPDLQHRRAAALTVLPTIRPAARKMKRVRMELDVLAARASIGNPIPRRPRTYALPLAKEHWTTVLSVADDDLWQREWELAARYADMLPSVAQAAGLAEDLSIPAEERVVLVLIDQLLRQPDIRSHVPLPEPVNRFAQPSRFGRRNGATAHRKES